MFNFSGITHIIENPNGHALGYNFSLVGSVPVSMLKEAPATTNDVMAGRAHKGPDGKLYAYHGRKWETVEEILMAARLHDVRMCESPGCACRKLF